MTHRCAARAPPGAAPGRGRPARRGRRCSGGRCGWGDKSAPCAAAAGAAGLARQAQTNCADSFVSDSQMASKAIHKSGPSVIGMAVQRTLPELLERDVHVQCSFSAQENTRTAKSCCGALLQC